MSSIGPMLLHDESEICSLHVEQNVTQAEDLYDKAVVLVELLDDSLVQRI